MAETTTTPHVSIVVRPATPHDDLTALFPETVGRKMNLDQILLADDGRILGGAIMFHAGHDLAYVGAIRFTGSERQPWVIKALWRGVERWCRAHGVVEVLHAAGTRDCAVAFERLGARPVRRDDVVLGLRLDRQPERLDDTQEAPSGAAIGFRFLNPHDAGEMDQLRDLIVRTKAVYQDRPWPWQFVFTTLGAWDEDRLVGYVLFSVGLGVTYAFGLRVDYPYRGQGLGRRLLALWLRIGARFSTHTAISGAFPGNAVMEDLLMRAGFVSQGVLPTAPEGEVLWAGDQRVFDWALAQPLDTVL